MSVESSGAIGVFDSGVGGLSVLKSIRQQLPHEDLIYLADSANAPYGDKDASFIEQRVLVIGQFLVDQNVKAIVVACNTATSTAVKALRSCFDIPIIGVEPAVKPAAAMTKSGVVAVLATQRTLNNHAFQELLSRHSAGVKVISQACPGFVELVERAELSGANVELLIQKYISGLVEQSVDIIVLGCTHYPFLSDAIKKLVGKHITILDTGEAVAREVRRRLEERAILRDSGAGYESFISSRCDDVSSTTIATLWGNPVVVTPFPGITC